MGTMRTMRRDIHDQLMHATWLATTACCTALHDIGFDTEEIAEVMPDAMKALADAIIEKRYDRNAIRFGQEHAERLAAERAGVQ